MSDVWQPGFAPLKPGELLPAGYGEVFCHPDTAAELLEDGLTVDGRRADATVVGIHPCGWQLRLRALSDPEWWAYGEHCIRTGARNRALRQAAVVDSVAA